MLHEHYRLLNLCRNEETGGDEAFPTLCPAHTAQAQAQAAG